MRAPRTCNRCLVAEDEHDGIDHEWEPDPDGRYVVGVAEDGTLIVEQDACD